MQGYREHFTPHISTVWPVAGFQLITRDVLIIGSAIRWHPILASLLYIGICSKSLTDPITLLEVQCGQTCVIN